MLPTMALLAGASGAQVPEPQETTSAAAPTPQEMRLFPPDSPVSVNGGGTSALSTASAAGIADCPLSYACGWQSYNYLGTRGQWAGNNPTWGAFSNGSCPSGTWKNCASSFYNHGASGCSVTGHYDVNYGPGGIIFWQGSASADLRNNGLADNNFESNSWC